MFWRLELREAKLAYAEGRWEEAAARLGSEQLREFLPAKRLSKMLADQYVARAKHRIDNGRSSAGWRDLAKAAELGANEEKLLEVQQAQRTARLQRVLQRLAEGELQLAKREAHELETRGLANHESDSWAEVLRKVDQAERLARRGKLAEAAEGIATAQRLTPVAGSNLPTEQVAAALAKRQLRYSEDAERLKGLLPQLHAQLTAEDWIGVLHTADAMLELAPAHPAARKARRRAWKTVGMEETQTYCGAWPLQPAPLVDRREQRRDRIAADTRTFKSLDSETVTEDNPAIQRPKGRRLVAWIDAVGGYLVCLGNEIVLGRPSSDGGVDVPISADLSRRHAVIRRDREAYVLEPINRVSVNGTQLTGPTVLHDGDRITLADAVELDFRRPHVLSTTAVLQITTHHKTAPAVDAVVLMADSCILGPQAHCHIPCRRWSSELVLFRHGEELRCRAASPMTVDGEPNIAQAALGENCRIEGEDFALSFEQL